MARGLAAGDLVYLDGSQGPFRIQTIRVGPNGGLFARLSGTMLSAPGGMTLDRLTHYYPDFTDPADVERWLRED